MRFLYLQGSEGELVGVVDFWVRLFPPAEPMDPLVEPETHRAPVQITLGWQDGSHEVNQRHNNVAVGIQIPTNLPPILSKEMDLSQKEVSTGSMLLTLIIHGRRHMTTVEGSQMSWCWCWSAVLASARAGRDYFPMPT